jgi:hypothetical protein
MYQNINFEVYNRLSNSIRLRLIVKVTFMKLSNITNNFLK